MSLWVFNESKRSLYDNLIIRFLTTKIICATPMTSPRSTPAVYNSAKNICIESVTSVQLKQ